MTTEDGAHHGACPDHYRYGGRPLVTVLATVDSGGAVKVLFFVEGSFYCAMGEDKACSIPESVVEAVAEKTAWVLKAQAVQAALFPYTKDAPVG